jgi:hypothetical protein
MFDSQKLAFDKFLLSYKHGIYVFTDDACHICQDYKQSIEYINNAYLYFVEVSTDSERKILADMLERSIFPLTVCFKDNKLKYVKPGQLFDTQLEPIFEDLKEFGDNPLSDAEIAERIQKEKTKCQLSYYIFAPSISNEDKTKIMSLAIKYNELPIDIDSVGTLLSLEEREHMLEGQMPFSKLVIFKDNKTNIFSSLAQKILINFAAIKGPETKFEVRLTSDILKETND